MKSTTIISTATIIFLTLICLLIFSVASNAQTSTSKKKSTQNIDINIDGNKVSLEMNDDVFDLDMVFDFDATDVIAAITDEFGSPILAGRFKTWKGNGYDIKIKNGNLDVFINSARVSRSTTRQMENIVTDLFSDLDLDIHINRSNY